MMMQYIYIYMILDWYISTIFDVCHSSLDKLPVNRFEANEQFQLIPTVHKAITAMGTTKFWPLKHQSRLQQTTNFETSFPIFDKNKVWYYMRIVCQQTILMKYHVLFVIFEKAANFLIVVCCKL